MEEGRLHGVVEGEVDGSQGNTDKWSSGLSLGEGGCLGTFMRG